MCRILVLDQGKVVEFGTPWNLMQANGMFRDLCKQSGEEAQLIEVSKPACGIRSPYLVQADENRLRKELGMPKLLPRHS